MLLVRDRTGRFRERPHYEPRELDAECEAIIIAFMRERDCELTLPLPTDALTKLIERDAADLDLYADLSLVGPDVEGLTIFCPGKKPRVRIARELSEDPRREHRLRTTLTHEYCHVKFHAYLWDAELSRPQMFPDLPGRDTHECRRETMLTAAPSDWMEWQAGYVCGALLMPITSLGRAIAQWSQSHAVHLPLELNSSDAADLVIDTVRGFDVSRDAARVRLSKLGYLGTRPAAPPLFG